MSSNILSQIGVQDAPSGGEGALGHSLRLRCPVCGRADSSLAVQREAQEAACPTCGFVFRFSGGICKALTPLREERFEQFVIECETLRRQEGRGCSGGHYYLNLPYKEIPGRNGWQQIRSRSFRFFNQRILPWLEYRYPQGLEILDVGAGNCWMSYRLALRGHRPVAVDLLVNGLDGLGAAHHYFEVLPKPFALFQAEMDRLPFDDAQFDLAVFNASFHYSENYAKTVKEVKRCLRRPGHLVILDTPCYQDGSAQRTLDESRLELRDTYGFRSDSIPSQDYLTPATLEEVARECGVEWKLFQPWYGVRWALRPLKARLLRQRPPAKFYILWATLGEA